jgi:hypothetical protein
MNINYGLAEQQKTISKEKAATCLTLRTLIGTDEESEAAAAIENGNQPDTLKTAREWHVQVEPGELKQVEGKEIRTAYT